MEERGGYPASREYSSRVALRYFVDRIDRDQRFFPDDVRERVFEPAYFDLVLDELDRAGGEAGGAAVDLDSRVALLLINAARIAFSGCWTCAPSPP